MTMQDDDTPNRPDGFEGLDARETQEALADELNDAIRAIADGVRGEGVEAAAEVADDAPCDGAPGDDASDGDGHVAEIEASPDADACPDDTVAVGDGDDVDDEQAETVIAADAEMVAHADDETEGDGASDEIEETDAALSTTAELSEDADVGADQVEAQDAENAETENVAAENAETDGAETDNLETELAATENAEVGGVDDPVWTAAQEAEQLRMLEALLFAASEPLDKKMMADRLPGGADIPMLLERLVAHYENRGVNLVETAGKYRFATAPDVAGVLEKEKIEPRKLTRAALETLAIIAYHQPCTRADIEDVRGVAVSKGSLDQLLEIGWVRLRGRRKDAPGRPVLYGTTHSFLEHFTLANISDLPGMADLKAAGLLDARLPPGFSVPTPRSDDGEGDDDGADAGEGAAAFVEDFMAEGDDSAGEASAGETVH